MRRLLLITLITLQFICTTGLAFQPAIRPLIRPAVARPAAIHCLADAGGDGGDSGGVGGGDGRGDGDDNQDGDDDDVDVAGALAKAGVDADSIPADMMSALEAGRIGDAELVNWAKVCENPLTKLLAASAYIRCRLLASPTLPTVLGIEIGVGCLSTLAAEKAARGEKFRQELDFVLANQVLIVLTNIALVLALTPAAAVAAPPAAGTLAASAAALPGFFLQAGEFTAAQRATCFFSKAIQFSAVGSLTSAVGQAVTKGLVEFRTRMNPDNPPQVDLAPVLPTAAAYAVFMAASSNTRYQLVNSLEAYGLPALPATIRTPTSFIVRTLNNVSRRPKPQ